MSFMDLRVAILSHYWLRYPGIEGVWRFSVVLDGLGRGVGGLGKRKASGGRWSCASDVWHISILRSRNACDQSIDSAVVTIPTLAFVVPVTITYTVLWARISALCLFGTPYAESWLLACEENRYLAPAQDQWRSAKAAASGTN